VYVNKPRTLAELKRNVEREIAHVTAETLREVMESVEKRGHLCHQEEGAYLSGTILHA
ncbi:hypothetical protein WH47_07659, partial [Habropoda laboriosa]